MTGWAGTRSPSNVTEWPSPVVVEWPGSGKPCGDRLGSFLKIAGKKISPLAVSPPPLVPAPEDAGDARVGWHVKVAKQNCDVLGQNVR